MSGERPFCENGAKELVLEWMKKKEDQLLPKKKMKKKNQRRSIEGISPL